MEKNSSLSQEKQVVSHTMIQLMGRAVVVLAGLAVTALLTRSLGVKNYGNYVFLAAFWSFLIALADWGTQIIGVRELSKKINTKAAKPLFSSLIRLRFFFLLASLIIGLVLIFSLPLFQDLRFLALIGLLIFFVINLQTSFFIAFQAFLKFNWQVIIESISRILFLVFLLIGLSRGISLKQVLFLFFLSQAIALSFAWRKNNQLFLKGGQAKASLIKFLFQESLPTGGLLFLYTAYDNLIDTGLLKHFVNPETVGIYGLSYKIYSNLILPAYFLTRSLFPHLSQQIKKKKEFAASFKLGVKWAVLGSILVLALTMVLAPPMISLLAGNQFQASVLISRILALALPFAYLNHIFGFSLIALGQQWKSFFISLASLLFNFLANWWLIPLWAASGAAIVTVSTEALVCLFSSLVLIKVWRKRKWGQQKIKPAS